MLGASVFRPLAIALLFACAAPSGSRAQNPDAAVCGAAEQLSSTQAPRRIRRWLQSLDPADAQTQGSWHLLLTPNTPLRSTLCRGATGLRAATCSLLEHQPLDAWQALQETPQGCRPLRHRLLRALGAAALDADIPGSSLDAMIAASERVTPPAQPILCELRLRRAQLAAERGLPERALALLAGQPLGACTLSFLRARAIYHLQAGQAVNALPLLQQRVAMLRHRALQSEAPEDALALHGGLIDQGRGALESAGATTEPYATFALGLAHESAVDALEVVAALAEPMRPLAEAQGQLLLGQALLRRCTDDPAACDAATTAFERAELEGETRAAALRGLQALRRATDAHR